MEAYRQKCVAFLITPPLYSDIFWSTPWIKKFRLHGGLQVVGHRLPKHSAAVLGMILNVVRLPFCFYSGATLQFLLQGLG